jgi:hypothetical protein
MSFTKTFWINTTDKELATSFTSNSTAIQPEFTQGDTIPIEVILLEKSGNDGLPFRNIQLTSETLKVALGRADQAATSGTFILDFDGDSTTALAFDSTAAQVQTALNLLTSITSAGGVIVSGSTGGPYTIAFNNVGARSFLTADLALLEPSSVLNSIRKQTGDGSTKDIQVLRIAEGALGLETSFSAIASPVASISTLIAGGSGANEVQQLIIDRPCIGGLIALTFDGETTSFNYGASASDVKASLEINTGIGSGDIAVTKVSDTIYTFEFIGALKGANQSEFTVDDSGLDGFVGFTGSLDLDNYSVESFLSGETSKDCLLEFELTEGSNKSTLATVSAKITNDIINSAITSPPLTPSITFVENVNGNDGVVVIDPDDLDDTSTANKFTNASDISKLSGIEAGATSDQSDAEIKTAYENNSNTNAFTDVEQTKLSGIEALAEVNDCVYLGTSGAISSDASVEFTTAGWFDGTYKFLVFDFINVLPATDATRLDFTASVDGGSTYLAGTSYSFIHNGRSGGSASATTSAGASHLRLVTGVFQGNGTEETYSGRVILYSPDSSKYKDVKIDSMYIADDGDLTVTSGAGQIFTTSAVDAVKLAFNSGNIASGEILVYGIKS